ncbi:MAG: roadblock/LC7 domain-containing protein [Verrucomicrobiaceae bacterium]|nr:roadblock/LC7 domain-containing protein [Verrucomicrobiaceae bacterium]
MEPRYHTCDPRTLELLQEIVALHGVEHVALTDGGGDFLVSLRSDGLPVEGLQTLSAVLAEAVLSAAGALSDRCGVGGPREINLQCEHGGLMMRPVSAERLLLVRYIDGVRLGLLRLVVSRAVASLSDNLAAPSVAPCIPKRNEATVSIASLRDAMEDSWSGF